MRKKFLIIILSLTLLFIWVYVLYKVIAIKKSNDEISQLAKSAISMCLKEPFDDKSKVEIENILHETFPDIEFNITFVSNQMYDYKVISQMQREGEYDIIYIDDLSYLPEYTSNELLSEVHESSVRDILKERVSDDTTSEQLFSQVQLNDRAYGIPITVSKQKVIAFRKDWLDKLGVNGDVTNISQLGNIFYGFKNNDPDGNGINDTMALCLPFREYFYESMEVFYQLSGSSYGNFYLNKDLEYTALSDENKKVTGTIAKWYSDGIIDSNVTVSDRNYILSKWENGRIGFLSGVGLQSVLPGGIYYEKLIKKNPNAEIYAVKLDENVNSMYDKTSLFAISRQTLFKLDSYSKMIDIISKMTENRELMYLISNGERYSSMDSTGRTIVSKKLIPALNDVLFVSQKEINDIYSTAKWEIDAIKEITDRYYMNVILGEDLNVEFDTFKNNINNPKSVFTKAIMNNISEDQINE